MNPDKKQISNKKVKKNLTINGNKKTPKVNGNPIQYHSQDLPTKNKWLHPEDSFGKLEEGTV